MGAQDDGFREFFSSDGGRLERFATFLVGDPVKGADLAQEALARVYARWGRVKDGSPGAYARKVVLNLVRSEHRARKLRALKPTPGWAEGSRPTDETAERVGESLRVVEALGQLSAVRRATVVLRFYEDLPVSQIAAVLGRPTGTVKADLHRALRQLRPLLEETRAGRRQP
jgi:RNA polymerase sigma-70 factor (sigma-E family)